MERRFFLAEWPAGIQTDIVICANNEFRIRFFEPFFLVWQFLNLNKTFKLIVLLGYFSLIFTMRTPSEVIRESPTCGLVLVHFFFSWLFSLSAFVFSIKSKAKKKTKKLVGSNVVSKLEKTVAGYFFVSPYGVAVGTLISKFRTRIKPLTPDNNKKEVDELSLSGNRADSQQESIKI